jgi:hypothetical protein
MNTDNKLYRSIVSLALATGAILLIPLIAMQFTDEVNWGLFDFIFAGVFIFGTGLTYKLVAKKKGNMIYRIAVGLSLGTAFLLIWINGAVGLIGSEENPANLMYFLVISVGIIGSLITRFQPQGMARALFAMAFAQVLVTVIALLTGLHHSPGSSVLEIIGVNGFFIAMFVVSALLFRRVAQNPISTGA